ncbi:MAG: HEPN domain-containing protein [Deltaproteobacteria bacterium]
MPLDPVLVEDTRAWLVKAAEDLRAADHERTAQPPLSGDIVFHAQQAAEKSLKAFLAWNDQPFRKTHNLIELGDACTRIDPALQPLLAKAGP